MLTFIRDVCKVSLHVPLGREGFGYVQLYGIEIKGENLLVGLELVGESPSHEAARQRLLEVAKKLEGLSDAP